MTSLAYLRSCQTYDRTKEVLGSAHNLLDGTKIRSLLSQNVSSEMVDKVLKPFLRSVPILYPLKTSENLGLFGVFREL